MGGRVKDVLFEMQRNRTFDAGLKVAPCSALHTSRCDRLMRELLSSSVAGAVMTLLCLSRACSSLNKVPVACLRLGVLVIYLLTYTVLLITSIDEDTTVCAMSVKNELRRQVIAIYKGPSYISISISLYFPVVVEVGPVLHRHNLPRLSSPSSSSHLISTPSPPISQAHSIIRPPTYKPPSQITSAQTQ